MVPFIDNDAIFHKADSFLEKYHPTFECPVPIEQIAEKKLGLFIFPINNLETTCEVHGGISKDFKTLVIDEREYIKQENRTRFTIAHEIGHFILHSQFLNKMKQIASKEDYVDFQNGVSFEDYKRIEIQANLFAEEILFPKKVLRKLVEENVEKFGGSNALLLQDIGKIIEVFEKQFGATTTAVLNKLKREFPTLIENAQANEAV